MYKKNINLIGIWDCRSNYIDRAYMCISTYTFSIKILFPESNNVHNITSFKILNGATLNS